MESNSTDLNALAQQLTELACQAASLIADPSVNLGIAMKGTDNPVTEVDYLVQQLIVTTLRTRFPTLKVIGEEDFTSQEFKSLQHFDTSPLDSLESYSCTLPTDFRFTKEYLTENLCVWVDPLDCTNGFIKGRKHQVTTLLGVTYNGLPILGVIGHPFKEGKGKGTAQYDPSFVIGSCQLDAKVAYEYSIARKQWIEHKQVQRKTGQVDRVATGYRIGNQKQRQAIKWLKLQEVKAGGAGYKALRLIWQQVQAVFFIQMKTAKWDSCAAEAIIGAMGGVTMQPNLTPIQYDSDGKENKDGFIMGSKQILRAYELFTSL